MHKLKFAIIGSLTENTQDLLDAVKDAGHQAVVIKLAEITFETIGGKMVAKHEKQNICDFDVIIFRGYNNHIHEAQMLAEMLTDEGKTIIEQSLANGYVRGKIQQARRLLASKMNHPKTFEASSIKSWNKILKTVKFPIIAKPIMGRKGRGIVKLDSFEGAMDFFSQKKSDYLIQQYFQIVSDFRVLVVGGKVVGGFERFINEGQYKSNIAGTRAAKIVLSEKMKNLAIAATAQMGYEIAGVDLFQHKGKLYIIEVNVCPQWEKFKLVTGINPAEHIIEYAIEKSQKN